MSPDQIQSIKDAASAANQQFQNLGAQVFGNDSLRPLLDNVIADLGALFTEADARFVAATQGPSA